MGGQDAPYPGVENKEQPGGDAERKEHVDLQAEDEKVADSPDDGEGVRNEDGGGGE